MFVTINHMDFDSGTIFLEINSTSRLAELREFLAYCSSLQFDKFHIVHNSRPSGDHIKKLKELAKEYDVTFSRKSPGQSKSTDSTSPRFRKVRRRKNGSSIEYSIRCFDFDNLRTVAKQFSLIVSKSIPLEERLMSRVRLCIYELVVNSLEHAKYPTAKPQVAVSMHVSDDKVRIVYKDNAARFPTLPSDDVSVKGQIIKGRTRGLGLFMIHKLTDSLKFERRHEWNCTTFILERRQLVT